MVLIFVEGNIGAGKSTLLQRLEPVLRAALEKRGIALTVLLEPVDEWRNVTGDNGRSHNLLEAFYKDPPRMALLFQSHTLVTRIRNVNKALASVPPTTRHVVLCERSVYTDRYVFVEALAAQGTITPIERDVYVNWWNFLATKLYDATIGGIMYLDVPPAVCEQHMIARNRREEAAVPLSYLEALHARHEAALNLSTPWGQARRLTIVPDFLDQTRDSTDALAFLVQQMVDAFYI